MSGAALSASFQLADQHKVAPHRLLHLNEYLKVNIPGPGSAAGDGYHWVQVKEQAEAVDKDAGQCVGLKRMPSVNPEKR